MQVNSARTPPNGWHFLVDGGKITLTAHDKKTLIDRLFEFRLRAGESTGTEEADIDSYFCTKWPSACNKDPKDYGHTHKQSLGEQLLYRVSRWAAGLIDRMPRGGYTLVSKEEADRRAAICSSCSKNAIWRTGCRGCSGSTVSLLNQARRMQKSPMNLLGCKVAGWDNASAIWLNAENLPISESLRQQLDEKCWRR